MKKPYRISRSKSKELAKTIQNFNAKISRLQRKGVKNLPEKESLRELKKKILSTGELNKEINRLKRFSRRGVEKTIKREGVEISKYAFNELVITMRTAKMKINRELKRLSNVVVDRANAKYAEVHPDEIQTLIEQKEKLNVKYALGGKDKYERQRRIDVIGKYNYRYSSKAKFVYQQSYLEMLGKIQGVDKDLIKELQEKIRNMSPNEFYDKYKKLVEIDEFVLRYMSQQDPSLGALEFSYDTEELLKDVKKQL